MVKRPGIGLLALTVVLSTGCVGQWRKVPVMSAETLAAHAEGYLRRDQPARAAELLASANEQGGTPQLRQREAAAWLAAGKLDEAEAVLDDDRSEGSARWHLLMAVLKLRRGDSRAADGHVSRYLEEYASEPGALALKAETAYRLGDMDDAVRALQTADGLLSNGQPLKSRVLYNLAVLQLRQGAFVEADAAFSRYISLGGTQRPEDRLLAGVMAYAARDHERAVRSWQSERTQVKERLAALLSDEADLYAQLVP